VRQIKQRLLVAALAQPLHMEGGVCWFERNHPAIGNLLMPQGFGLTAKTRVWPDILARRRGVHADDGETLPSNEHRMSVATCRGLARLRNDSCQLASIATFSGNPFHVCECQASTDLERQLNFVGLAVLQVDSRRPCLAGLLIHPTRSRACGD
jgi:hypothetical protein